MRSNLLNPSESQIQASILSWGDWQEGVQMFRINVIGVPMGDNKFRPSPNVGMADIHMTVRTEGISVGVWLEVKRKGKHQSKTQKVFEKRVKEQSGWYFIVRSIEDVQQVVRIIRDDTWKKINKLRKEFNEFETGQG
jgi:hypothetical protein